MLRTASCVGSTQSRAWLFLCPMGGGRCPASLAFALRVHHFRAKHVNPAKHTSSAPRSREQDSPPDNTISKCPDVVMLWDHVQYLPKTACAWKSCFNRPPQSNACAGPKTSHVVADAQQSSRGRHVQGMLLSQEAIHSSLVGHETCYGKVSAIQLRPCRYADHQDVCLFHCNKRSVLQ